MWIRRRKKWSPLGEHSLPSLSLPQRITLSLWGCKKTQAHFTLVVCFATGLAGLPLPLLKWGKVRAVRATVKGKGGQATPPWIPGTQRFRRCPSKHVHRIQRLNKTGNHSPTGTVKAQGRENPHIRGMGCVASSWGSVTLKAANI